MTGVEFAIKFAKVLPNASIPVRAHTNDAGMDLSSCVTVTIPAGEHRAISTGIAVSLSENCYARIAPRSGLAFKYAIDVLAGVVDIGYTDEIRVILINHGNTDFVVKEGDRIAQIIFESILIPVNVPEITYMQLKAEAALNKEMRGLGGFGSTGV
jgi:dUTP pyrophosphatase